MVNMKLEINLTTEKLAGKRKVHICCIVIVYIWHNREIYTYYGYKQDATSLGLGSSSHENSSWDRKNNHLITQKHAIPKIFLKTSNQSDIFEQ